MFLFEKRRGICSAGMVPTSQSAHQEGPVEYHQFFVSTYLDVFSFISVENRERKNEKRATDEQRLYKYLMRNYDPNTRPVFNASHPVNVSIGITLTQIFDVVSIRQTLTLRCRRQKPHFIYLLKVISCHLNLVGL